VLVALLVALAFLALPGQALAAPAEPTRPTAAASDPLGDLGATSPSCRDDVGAQALRNCRATGSIAHGHPLNSYGYDIQIGFSISHLDRSFLGALQSIGALIWMALVFLVKGVLLLLEWGFSIDLLGTAMAQARTALTTLHEQVIGQPWFLAALSFAGLWGIWHGLVRRQATQTIAGLCATAGLMVCGLVVLARPDETVGHASRLANQAALGVLSAATTRHVEHPEQSLATASIGVFDSIVRDPWCALEFGSVVYCRHRAAGSATKTNADVWLAYPAQSRERKALYRLLKGRDPDGSRGVIGSLAHPALDAIGLGGDEPAHLPDSVKRSVAKDPPRAAMQEAGDTFPRFALLGLIAMGTLGAAALLAYLGVRLLLASVLALLLLLFTPAVLLAPAFGESGRATFIAWAKRLVGALVAKLVYALFLAVVLAGAAALRGLEIGWFGTWLLQIAFWWGVLLKRHELIGFVSVPGAQRGEPRSSFTSALAHGYYVTQLGRMATRSVRTAAERPARLAGSVARRGSEARLQQDQALGQLAAEYVDADGRRVLTEAQERAYATLDARTQLQRELRIIDRKLAGFDEAHAATRATDDRPPVPTNEQRALITRRRHVLQQLASPEMRAAEQLARHADSNIARTGDNVGAADLAAYRRQRAADHAAGLPADHERHLQAAGIDPRVFHVADEDQRAAMREAVERHLERERDLLAALPEAGGTDPAARRRAQVHIDPTDFRARVAEQRAQARRDRREQRMRSMVRR
jgi:hypothetical protein